jgi:hypothetical protein
MAVQVYRDARWVLKEVAYQGTEQRLISSGKDKATEVASGTAARTVLVTASAGE